jgi:hypothetical protein
VHPLLACLCNSRIVQPAHAGDVASWPLLLLWGGQLAVAAAGVMFWLARRRSRRSAARAAVDEHWGLTGTFLGGPDAGVDDDQIRGGPSPVAAESGPASVAKDLVGPPDVEAETIQRR